MTRYARRTDNTHADVRDGLRMIWGDDAVIDTHNLGDDFPDLLFGAKGVTVMIEVKTNQNKRGVRYRKSATNASQAERRARWRGGPWIVAHDLDGAQRGILAALGRPVTIPEAPP